MTQTTAIVLENPKQLSLRQLLLAEPQSGDVIVDVEWSGISTGTERLLWNGDMPPFPGMGYPLVPGYESVGRVRQAGPTSGHHVGERVFVPGARCYGDVRGLFGATASTLVVPGDKAYPVGEDLGDRAVLLALAATAYHAVAGGGARVPVQPPDLIVGHGVLGRLLARMTMLAEFPAPTVWETNPERAGGATGYPVLHPDEDKRTDYHHIYDVSGDSSILDRLIGRLAPGGEIVLAGFYSQPLSFMFPPAFVRETQIRVAAEWKRADLLAVREIADAGLLPLDDLITHHAAAGDAERAYRTAFSDNQCLKMVIDWTGRA
jgi:3-hydroxyethyl bacteriochlorophyllide a dehydrogenase